MAAENLFFLLNALLWDVRAQRLYIDGHQSHGMNCLCGTLRCNDQGFCWKAESCGWWSKHGLRGSFVYNVNSRASHLGMSQKRETDPRSARRFFLARVVSVTYQPWHLYTFHLCGCWMRRLDYRSVRTGKRVFRNCQSSNVSEDRPSRFQGCPECVTLRHLLECLERGEELAPCLDSWRKSNFQYVYCGFNCRTSMATWYMVPMPSMFYIYDWNCFDTIHLL